MRLVINGKPEEVGQVTTLKELLELKNLPEGQVVMELNGGIVPRERWAAVILQPEDTIEILRFVGGG